MTGIACVWMRGGTSKGGYFLADDLPAEAGARDRVLRSVMGSPDPRQIDGMGGAHPLTSKVAVVSASSRPDCDVDYLFLQVQPASETVSDAQNCGNILAGVGPFAIEHGLVEAGSPTTEVKIRMVNSDDRAVATVATPGGRVTYEGEARIDGVPGTAAPVMLDFLDTAGSMCGALFPTGNPSDQVAGVEVTLIDNGMPVVLLRAADFDLTGGETVAELEANEPLKSKLEEIRLAAGRAMHLGDVTDKTVPKMILVSPPAAGGAIATRSFIPHRVHETIGVFAAVTVATACLVPGSVAHDLAVSRDGPMEIEHPGGALAVDIEVEAKAGEFAVRRSGFLRTARKLFEGEIHTHQEKDGS